MFLNKDHWYDGWFYDKLIAPNQDKVFSYVKGLVELNSSLIDIGCGTGRLAFQMQDKCRKIDGVDLSQRNILLAKKKLQKSNSTNINFHHSDIIIFLKNAYASYNYAVLSYVLHEIHESQREKILTTVSLYAEKIIIIDYLVPKPKNVWRYLNEIVEYFAGREHYDNFKSYIENGGLIELADSSRLKISNEFINKSAGTHIAILQK